VRGLDRGWGWEGGVFVWVRWKGGVLYWEGSGRVGRWGFLMMEVVASIICYTSNFPFDKNQKPSFT
jgi:hypothetical protein